MIKLCMAISEYSNTNTEARSRRLIAAGVRRNIQGTGGFEVSGESVIAILGNGGSVSGVDVT